MIYVYELLSDVQHDLGPHWRNIGNEYLLKALQRACQEIQKKAKLSFLYEDDGKILIYEALQATIDDTDGYHPTATTLRFNRNLSSVAMTVPTANVNTTTDTITVTAHGYIDGTPVVYAEVVNPGIGGLTNGGTYYIINATTNTFQLSTEPNGAVIDLTSQGSSNDQSFTANHYPEKYYYANAKGVPKLYSCQTGHNYTLATTSAWATSSGKTTITLSNSTPLEIDPHQAELDELKGSECYIYFDRYALPADCGFNDELIIKDKKAGLRLRKITEPLATTKIIGSEYWHGNPLAYMPVTTRTTGTLEDYDLNYITFWPILFPDTRYLSISYFKNLYALSTIVESSHAPILQAPKEYIDVFYMFLMAQGYLRVGDNRFGYYDSKYRELLRHMIEQNNADLAWQAELESYPEGQLNYPDGLMIKVVT